MPQWERFPHSTQSASKGIISLLNQLTYIGWRSKQSATVLAFFLTCVTKRNKELQVVRGALWESKIKSIGSLFGQLLVVM